MVIQSLAGSLFYFPGPGFLKEDLEEAIKDLKSHDLITSNDFLKCLELKLLYQMG